MSDVAKVQAAIEQINEETKGSVQRYGFDFDNAQIGLFLQNHSADETISQLRQFAEWQQHVNRQNHDGVTLTPVLIEYIAGSGNIADKLIELDRLREDARHGRFDPSNPIGRDLEFHRFNWAYREEIADGTDPALNGPYEDFVKLPVLPAQTHDPFVLDGQHLIEARRIAYEAYLLLGFLRKFKASTSRPVVVVGNDRYGRQWGVEPIEDYLKDDFKLVFPRVPSHKSTRLTVPDMIERVGIRAGFHREFIQYLSDEMPHVVVVDARNVGQGKDRELMRMSRGARDYANWFIAFNDLRADGDVSKYDFKMPHLANHYPELKKWYKYVEVERKMRPWVSPGETYAMTLWAPTITDEALLGDFKVKTRKVEYGSDEAQVVLANPIVYKTDEDDPNIHENLRGNRPYYYDGPEKFVKHTLQFGFGDYGLESRVIGNTTDEFVEAVQGFMKQEIARLGA
jgi:hypothetical protein